jgi:hypothetical protein
MISWVAVEAPPPVAVEAAAEEEAALGLLFEVDEEDAFIASEVAFGNSDDGILECTNINSRNCCRCSNLWNINHLKRLISMTGVYSSTWFAM